eukprot:scaffold4222_cov115-Cylindrotheca_fusiformis.AAC.4
MRTFKVLWITAALGLAAAERGYLYWNAKDDHSVQEYTGEEGRFMDSTNPRVVEFYSPSCSACIEFMPEYILLADTTTLRFEEIEFFAVSCDDHLDVCRDFGIDIFPALKVFPANGDGEGIDITDYEMGYTVELIASKLGLLSVTEDKKLQERPEFTESPTYMEAESTGAEGSDKDYSVDDDQDSKYADISNRDEDSDEGSAAREDQNGHKFSGEMGNSKDEMDQGGGDTYKTSAEASADADGTANSRQSKGIFDMAGIGANSDFSESRGDSDGSPKISAGNATFARREKRDLDRFREHMKKKNARRKGLRVLLKDMWKRRGVGREAADPEEMTKGMKMNTPGTEEFISRRKSLMERLDRAKRSGMRLMKPFRSTGYNSVSELESLPYHKDIRRRSRFGLLNAFSRMSEEERLILDVTNAFHFGLKTGLFRKNDQLSQPQLVAFRKYLELLSVSLPPEWRLHRLISDLRKNVEQVARGRENLHHVLEKYPIQNGWSKDCHSGGFACGLWRLLHTVTVGVAEHRGGLNLIESELIIPSSKTFSPMEAAETIRDYLDHFFTCGPCRDEFIENYDNCKNNRRCARLTNDVKSSSIADWKELATWLWEVHNEVSVRIVHTRAKRMYAGLPSSKEVVVPIADEIKALWPQYNDCVRCLNEDGRWDEAEIFNYLEKKYW